jgi:hypothetical protein
VPVVRLSKVKEIFLLKRLQIILNKVIKGCPDVYQAKQNPESKSLFRFSIDFAIVFG